MKTSRANSFRLQRLSKTNSLLRQTTKYNPNETFKIASINSVSRGVKYVELNPLTGHDLRKLRKEPLQQGDSFFESAHQSFTQIRKKYDDMKKQRVEKEEIIRKMKEDKLKYQIFSNEYSTKISYGKNKVDQLQKNLQNKKILLQQTIIDKKVLQHMRFRHKSDKVFYDQRKFDLNKQLNFLKSQLNVFKKEGFEIGESTDRSIKIYDKLLHQLSEENKQRQQHLSNLQDMINQKKHLSHTNQIREEQIRQIAERALQDKDQNQKQWRKIYYTNLFVSKMLRAKIQKQMEKFSIVEIAFKSIKTATGISDGKTLIQKYLNKQAAYGDLLGKIAQNQKRIQNLKAQTEKLIKEEKELEMEKQVIESIKIKTISLKNQMKSLQIYNQKKKIIQEKRTKVKGWLSKQLKKLKSLLKQQNNIHIQSNNASLIKAFTLYLKLINQEVDFAQKHSLINQQNLQYLNDKDMQKITRIRPKKSRKNSMGEDIFDLQEQQASPGIISQECQLIDIQRDYIIKQNQKFMKQVKKKRDEMRRKQGQKMFDRKQKSKIPEIKKQIDEL